MITLSYGGGKQTVALITLILEGKLPKPDLIVMADTSREVSTTWDYLEKIVQPALAEIGLKVEIAGHNYSKVDLYKGDKVLIPAFTNSNNKHGKLPTYCSSEWKQRVIRRWMRDQGVTQTDLWLGISTDEAERMKINDVKWCKHVYPLIEIIPMSRLQCEMQIQQFGWEVPHKSRCWMCPNQSPEAWRNMKLLNDGDFDKAILLEKEMREKDSTMFLHTKLIPLEVAVEIDNEKSDLFDGCDSGYCWT